MPDPAVLPGQYLPATEDSSECSFNANCRGRRADAHRHDPSSCCSASVLGLSTNHGLPASEARHEGQSQAYTASDAASWAVCPCQAIQGEANGDQIKTASHKTESMVGYGYDQVLRPEHRLALPGGRHRLVHETSLGIRLGLEARYRSLARCSPSGSGRRMSSGEPILRDQPHVR